MSSSFEPHGGDRLLCGERVRARPVAQVPRPSVPTMQCRSSEESSRSQVRENARGVCVARWYDPGTGQFLSVDPDLAETDQPYAYAGDDPVNESDPTGDSVDLCLELTAFVQPAMPPVLEPVGSGGGVSKPPGSGKVSLPAGAVYQRIGVAWNALIADGNTHAQVAGIIGNLLQESNLQPSSEDTPGVAYGIAQWSPQRWSLATTNFPNVESTNTVRALSAQLTYLWVSFSSRSWAYEQYLPYGADSYPNWVDDVAARTSPKAAADAFSVDSQGPGIPDLENRECDANHVFALFGGPPTSCISETWP